MRDSTAKGIFSWASSKATLTSAAAIVALGTALGTNIAFAQLPPVQHYNQIEYISGGIGIDESTAIKQAMPQFPLALTFAQNMGETNAYVAEVQVVVRNEKGDTVFQVPAAGPYLLIRLPPGHYKVAATYQGKTITQAANVAATGSARAMFDWRQ